MSLPQLLFSFQGRMRRSQWWAVRIVVTIIAFVVGGGALGIAGAFDKDANPDPLSALAALIVIPVAIAYLWIFVATAVKRLHDTGQTGWFTVLFFIPYLGGLIALVMLGIIDSTRGTNKYGPSEKYPEAVATVFS
jgi:uncharacterized membrane protein YhaH (DUF805 family)